MKKRVLLHIGTGKTGTSSIQNFLCRNRDVLLSQHGLLYPITGLEKIDHFGEEINAHYPVVSWILKRDEAQLKQLCSEIENSKADLAVISCENLYHGLGTDDISYLAGLLKGFDTRIACYVRRQDQYMESAWKQQVKVGGLRAPFPVFLRRHVSPEYLHEVHANYERMLKPWAAAFGIGNIAVRVFDRTQWRNRDLIDDFLDQCQIENVEVACSLPKPPLTNVSIPSELLRLLCRINGMQVIPHNEQQEFVGYLRGLREYNNPPLLTRDDRVAIIKNYTASNEELFRVFTGQPIPPCFTEAALPVGAGGAKPGGAPLEDIALKSLVAAWRKPGLASMQGRLSRKITHEFGKFLPTFSWVRQLSRKTAHKGKVAKASAKPWPPVLTTPLGFEPNVKPREVARLIKQGLDEAKPMSIIRLGDGESAVIGYPDFTPSAEFDRFLRVFFGDNTLSEEQKLEFVAIVRSAVRAADVVGVNGGSEVNRFTVVRHFMQHYNLANPDTHITIPSLHRNFQELGLYDDLLRNQDEVGLITCRDVEELLKERFNINKITTYKIPEEVAHSRNKAEVARHFPDRFEEIRKTLVVSKPGMLFLIGAGPLGKVYCQWVKERGGVAVDVGSIFDAWAGLATRRYMKSDVGRVDQQYQLSPPNTSSS